LTRSRSWDTRRIAVVQHDLLDHIPRLREEIDEKPGRSRALFSSTIRSPPPFATDEHIGYFADILVEAPPVAFPPIFCLAESIACSGLTATS
jgi:hypothetical protein